jgi:DNA helicase HerA-like ATPase
MFKNEKILIGSGENEVFLLPSMANRHGLICGATGTGKTVTLKVLAESFSDMGVPVFLADIKGDLSGCIEPGEASEAIKKRLSGIGIDPESFEFKRFPVRFWDVFGEKGHPVRTTVSRMGPELLSRLLGLTPAQSGVLSIVFRAADDNGWELIDLKDLRAMLVWCTENASALLNEYGNISKQSAGALQRSLLQLEDAGGSIFFGEPAIDLHDWMRFDPETGGGMINILCCEKLYRSPLLYSTFMLWLLSELFEMMPEIGDPEKPKLVFFFDEAHLLFRNANRTLLDSIEQLVKLIRSKGIGVYFITQQPSDIPGVVLSQLGNKIQHALRAYTPAEMKSVRAAADSFRSNPSFDTAEAITGLGTGEAVISTLDAKGRPCVAEKAVVLPPQSMMGIANEEEIAETIGSDSYFGKYEDTLDRRSAYEIIKEDSEKEEAAAEDEEKAEQSRKKTGKKTSSGTKKTSGSKKTTAAKKAASKVSGSLLGAVGRELGRSIARGLLGIIKK